ncbi:exo-alpha-sialidase [Solirubrobacter sp. CPCC 204708]|uniref:Exo-alpha-sialidase n=1 Tax=Solirubrobacter deserti TaxID=2282478 RepID=A0ABT4RJX6_9ACTN|nr:hypothetical protein [Solirubrobacter deserti]MBE2315815.1 exo-alpha-sialidase [Solirubrobacter deserti]MDA0138849.1 hypothetical protein [Solirubrobacter deserti]
MRRRVITWLGALAVSACIAACGEEPAPTDSSAQAPPADAGPVHIHGLGVNPADGSTLIATHTGLFSVAPDADRAQRIGDSSQDTMGFAIVGPDHFLGSGHPDPSDTDLPPYLGLIESKDAGRSWQPVSLHGEVDFHVLESAGERIYGFGSDFATREPRFLTSADGGRSWDPLTAPEPLISLALAPDDPQRLIASGERGLHRSGDGGRTWEPVEAPGPGHLAWTEDGVTLLDLEGQVHHERTENRWRPAGNIGGQPAAFDQGAPGELLAALHDGVVMHSRDRGQTWVVRSRP